jgi:hypothetical protein
MAKKGELTPIQELDKRIKEDARELRKSSDSLRAPFKKLVDRIQNINGEFAKIAVENIGQTRDTWKGLITQGKKERLIRQQESDKDFQAASKAVKDQQKNQAILETKKINQEQKHIQERKDVIDNDKYLNQFVLTRKAKLEKEYLTSNKSQREDINKELGDLASTISERETFLVKSIDTKNDQVMSSIDTRIKQERDGVKDQQIYLDETNDALKEQLEKAGKTENYDKFTSSVKTLSGGLINISGVLDPIANTIGALKDLGDVASAGWNAITSPMKKFSGFLTDSREEQLDQSEEIADKTGALAGTIVKQEKKTKKGFMSFIKNLGVTGIIMMVLAAAVLYVLSKLGDLGDFINTLTGNKTPMVMDEATDLTSAFNSAFAAEKDPAKQSALVDEYNKKMEPLLEKAQNRVSEENFDDTLGGTAVGTAVTTGTQAGRLTGDKAKNIVDAVREVSTSNSKGFVPQARDAVTGQFIKTPKPIPSVLARTGAALEGVLKPANIGKVNVLTSVLSAGLTAQQVMSNLSDTATASEKVDALLANDLITQEEWDAAQLMIADKQKQDTVQPTTMALVGAGASMVIGTALAFTGIGTAPGIALAAGGGMVFGLGSGVAVDVAYTGDDELYAFLESKGVNIDPREAENYKDIMQEKVDGINSTNQKIKNARDGATFDDIPGATFNSSQIQLDQSSDTQNNIIQGLPTTRDSGATVGLLNPVLN